MRRILLYILQLAVLVGAAVWLADHPGTVVVEWQGYRVETQFALLIVAVVGLFVLLNMALAAWRAVTRAPGSFVARRTARRREEGYRALALGMAAATAGDREETMRLARRADALLREPEVTRLLSAQAAALSGDEEAARRYFDALTDNEETAFLGLTGLLRQALRENDTEQAFAIAERARRLRPDSSFVVETLFDLQSRAGRWTDAQATLFDAVRRKIRPEAEALEHRLAIFAARAQEALDAGRDAEALELSDRALATAADFIPAIVMKGRSLARSGKTRTAARLIETSWPKRPHPDLVAVYTGLWPQDTPLDRFRRIQKLTSDTQDERESRLAIAAAALDSRFWGEARRVLAGLGLPDDAGARACMLMARLEQEEHGDSAAARSWLERAAGAQADEAWTCRSCGAGSPDWAALCGNCGAFATIDWRKPPGVALLPVPPEPEVVIESPVAPTPAPEDGDRREVATVQA